MKGLAITKFKFEPFDIYNIGYDELFEDYFRKITVTNTFLDSSKTFIVLVEADWICEPDIDIVKKFDFFTEVQELLVDKNKGLYICYGEHLPVYSEVLEVMATEFYCFIEYPLVYARDGVYLEVAGKRTDILRLKTFLEGMGLRFEIKYIRDYHVLGKALMADLTQRQYQCLKRAVREGYYEIPRKKDLRDLAALEGITHGAYAFHLRKAQRSMLKAMFH